MPRPMHGAHIVRFHKLFVLMLSWMYIVRNSNSIILELMRGMSGFQTGAGLESMST